MGNIFGHGRLRLYLLKLLDESPRHGYEIITVLRDRFLGVYSPSPGTIYPRLARLEEEGLVTHEEVNGRKVYRLTDAGREELHRRTDDLSALERDLVDSAHEIARTVKRDVRDTISSLRAELKGAADQARRARRPAADSEPTGDVWAAASTEDASSRSADTDAPPAADERPAAGAEEPVDDQAQEPREESTEDGTRGADSGWGREWERIARGFGAFGSNPEFERTLREFHERVQSLAREAGSLGESAAEHLRRILDETVEVIRRDMAAWGGSREDAGESGAPDGPDSDTGDTGAPRDDDGTAGDDASPR